MKSFEELYLEFSTQDDYELLEMYKKLKTLQIKREKIALNICIIIDVIYAVVTILIKGMFNIMSIPLLIFILILNFIIYVISKIITMYSKEGLEYTKLYKSKIISKLIKNFYEKMEYFPDKGIPQYIYRECFEENYDIYRSEDYIETYLNNKYPMQIGEIYTAKIEKIKKQDGTIKEQEKKIFHGMLCKIIMDKSIEDEIKVYKNNSFVFKKNKLKMDSNEFEKNFDVIATNAIKALQILTSDVMEEFIEFKKNTEFNFNVYIKCNEIYLIFECGNMFEVGNLKNDMLEKEVIKKYYNILSFIYKISRRIVKIIEELNI